MLPLLAFAQSLMQNIHFDFKGIEDGLSVTTIDCIYEDRRGFIWLGTQNGLNKYDGYNFVKFHHKRNDSTSLGEDYIRAITEGDNGDLWICSYSGGVSIYSQKTGLFSQIVHKPGNNNSLIDNRTVCILYTRDRNFWIGTEHGLSFYDPARKIFKNYSDYPDQRIIDYRVKSICEDNNRNIWIGTADGTIVQYNPSGKVISLDRQIFLKHGINTINCIFCDSDNIIWVASDQGLFSMNVNNGVQMPCLNETYIFKGTTTKNKEVNTVCQDKNGQIIAGTSNQGIYIVNPNEKKKIVHCVNDPRNPRTLRSDNIYNVFSDRKNNLWVATEAGLNIHFNNKEKFLSYSSNTDDIFDKIGAVWGIYSVDSTIYIGTTKRLLQLNSKNGKLIELKSKNIFRYKNHYCFFKINNRILVGTADGIEQFEIGNEIKSLSRLQDKELSVINEKRLCVIIRYDSSSLWLGTYDDGLYLWNYEKHTIRKYPASIANGKAIANEVINVIYKGTDGTFWFGTDNGFSHYYASNDSFANFYPSEKDSNSISKEYVYSFYDDSVNLWIGTYGGGLNCMKKATGKFKVWTEEQGLADNAIYGILPDEKGRLWMSTNHGISCFDKSNGQFKNYTESDGLQSNEFNHWAFYKSSDATLYFGGVNGISKIGGGQIATDTTIPPVLITSIGVSDQPYYSGINISDVREIKLSYLENKINFEFAVLDMASSHQNRYRYKLTPIDKNYCTETGSNRVGYSNLSPGKYVFTVIGCNHDGTWNTKGTSIDIIIYPPFYKTWWFVAVIITCIIAIIISVYKYRVGQILKVQNMRNRIARDLHDDIGAALGSISIYSSVAQNRIVGQQQGVVDVLEKIGNTSREMIDNMSDIVWSVNPDNDTIEQLVLRMKSFASMILPVRNINYDIHEDLANEKVKFTMQQRKNIYLIYKETVYNLVKYADCSDVQISLVVQNKKFSMVIADNGRGFDIDKITPRNGNGLRNIKFRAKEINAHIEIISNTSGTKIILET